MALSAMVARLARIHCWQSASCSYLLFKQNIQEIFFFKTTLFLGNWLFNSWSLISLIRAEWTACARSWRVRVWRTWSTWSLTTRGRKHSACTPCWNRDSQSTSLCTNRKSNSLMSGGHWAEGKMTFSFMTGLLPVVDTFIFTFSFLFFYVFYFLITILFYPLLIRCGRLTHHISLPYSVIGVGHVEGAIKDTYCKRMCGECTHEV